MKLHLLSCRGHSFEHSSPFYSSKLLLVLASTVVLDFGPLRDPWPCSCSFHTSTCFEMGPPLRWEEGSDGSDYCWSLILYLGVTLLALTLMHSFKHSLLLLTVHSFEHRPVVCFSTWQLRVPMQMLGERYSQSRNISYYRLVCVYICIYIYIYIYSVLLNIFQIHEVLLIWKHLFLT
jgi:hypothetical protein